MVASNWEQKKKNALELLQQLLDIWQGRRPLNEIISIGPQCSAAVLALGLETELPLPYDEKKMGDTSLAAIFGARDRGGAPNDEVSKNINAWIHLIEKAEYVPAEEEIPPERRSPPVSLKRLVECWGGDMTRKKLRKAIDLGSVRAVKITRQTYVFDTDKLPTHVIEKLKKE